MTARRVLYPRPIRRHGTIASYNLGCRCTLCVAVSKDYWTAFYHERPDRKSRHREYWYQRQYGKTIGELDAMLVTQGGRCRLCRRPLAAKFGGKGNSNHVDHKHGTKIVRGILCDVCNKGLGHFSDDPAMLRRAAEYVESDGRLPE